MPQTTGRMEWMDLLRGVAIILVIVWHAPAIPALLGAEMPEWLRATNNFLLPYRMPLLMLLSGLLVPRGLEKPIVQYLWGKVQFVLWPYLLWTAIHMLQHYPPGSLTIPRRWIAAGYLWFLFYIGVMYLIAPLFKRVPAWIPPAGFVAAAFLLPDGLSRWIAYYAVFFFVGVLVARHPQVLDALTRRVWIVAIAAAATIAFGVTAALVDTQRMAWGIPFSLCGILVAVAIAQRVRDGRLSRSLQFVGRSSLVFYVAHFPVIYIGWQIFASFGAESTVLTSFVLFVLAVAACTGLAYAQRVRPFAWLFRAPGPKRLPIRA